MQQRAEHNRFDGRSRRTERNFRLMLTADAARRDIHQNPRTLRALEESRQRFRQPRRRDRAPGEQRHRLAAA